MILASYLSFLSPIRCIAIMATDKKDWQEVDPRVEWAMKIFDWGDDEPNGIVQAAFIPFSEAAVAGAALAGRNHVMARPLWAGAPYTIAATVAGGLLSGWWLSWKARRQQESILHEYNKIA